MTNEAKEEKIEEKEEGDKDSGKGASQTGSRTSLKSCGSRKSGSEKPEGRSGSPEGPKGSRPNSSAGSKKGSQVSVKPVEPEVAAPVPAVPPGSDEGGDGENGPPAAAVASEPAQITKQDEEHQASGSDSARVKLLVGPVIGHVTSTTAIVLIEIDTDLDQFELVLKEIRQDGEPAKQLKKTKNIKAKSPTVFQFQNLPPKTAFNVVAPVVSAKNIGMVRTLPSNIERLNIAIVSCDYGVEDGKYDHWSKLWGRVNADQLHLVLHLGDNVYIDGTSGEGKTNEELVEKGWKDPDNKDFAYVKARHILNDTPKEEWESKTEDIRELYREVYRKTWNRPHERKVLATISNLMICDDHEFRDNLGSVDSDGDPETAEFFLTTQALRVFHEYQRQLWDPEVLNRNPEKELSSEFYSIVIGSLGIMMTETRTKGSVYKANNPADDKTYFGQKQYEEIQNAFSSSNQVKMWLFASPLPLLFVKKKLAEIAGKFSPDAEADSESLMQVSHREEMGPLLQMFHDWESNHPGNQLLVLSGDVHLGGFTDIHIKKELDNGDEVKELVCRQLTSSGITNRQSTLGSVAVRSALHFTEDIGPFSYNHYDWTKEYNFMIVNIDSLDTYPHYLVKQFYGEKGALVKDSNDRNWDVPALGAPPSACCNIL